MARLEITVKNTKTDEILAREIFEVDSSAARLLIERLEKMVAGFEKPAHIVKTISPNGVVTLDIQTGGQGRPPVEISHPTFEDRFRRPALPPPQEDVTR